MNSRTMLLVLFTVLMFASAQADLIVYPKEGQSAEQTEKDKFECYGWAKETTGFDPMAVPKTTSPPPNAQPKQGGAARGAAVGAIAGRIVSGGSSRTAKRSAAAGAVIGGARQGAENQGKQQEKQQWEQQQASEYAAQRNKYNRAFGACLEGRGYSVK